ncbi:VapE domain-containing protein [Methylibium sp.]|uniref:VapE domain-containing protein n=1 Tax=Methylibium sp. TaxID=2067992 RepID=UPI003D0A3ABB
MASDIDDLCRRLESMPALMRELKQWLLWRFEPDAKRPEKPRKVPYYASGRRRRGDQGSVQDREDLVSLNVAMSQLRAGRYDGVGFAFLPGDGLIGVDIDGAIDPGSGEISERCQSIIESCASYTEFSPSGRGVHIIGTGTIEKTFKDNRVGVEVFTGRQFFTCTGRAWPGAADTVNPISPETLERLKRLVDTSKQRAAAEKRKASGSGHTPSALPVDQTTTWLEQALSVLDSGGVSYDEWIGIGMALRSALGDGAFGMWDYWSSKGGDRYCGQDKALAHWRSFPGTDADGAMVVFKTARRGNRWRPPPEWHEVYGSPRTRSRASTRVQSDEGADTPDAAPAGSSDGGGSTPTDGSAGEGSAPADRSDWRDDLLRSNGGKKDCRENVYLCLINHPTLKAVVGYDEFSHRVMKLKPPPWDSTPGEWTTNDDYLLGFYLAKQERLVIKGEGTIVAGVAMAAFHNRYHPVHKYLHGLKPWDEVERMPFWLHECLGADDNEYTRLVGPWFLMGMVRRVLDPGCQMDYMVVLEGLQGKQKSTALRILVGNDEWFADTPIRVGEKDAMLSLAGIWLYEIGELESFSKAEVTAVKQYVSSRVDRVREPFARRPTDRRRSGVFAGSTNASEYFKDPTGARRFWPVACNGEIDLAKLAEWRDMLYAEAMHRLKSSDQEVRRYWPTREEADTWLAPEQEKRQIVDPWFEKLATWLDSKAPYGDSGDMVRDVKCFTSYELLVKALNVPIDRIDGGRQMATRVGTAMHALKWDKQRDSTGARVWRYYRPKAAENKAQAAPDGAAGDGQAEVLHEF